MDRDEENYTVNHFSKLFEKHDDSFKSLDWGSSESQNLRFEVLANIANLQGKSVLDVGCGLGDFYKWLVKNNINIEYSGLDITPHFIKRAISLYEKPSFFEGNILDASIFSGQKFDYVMASGIFSTYKDGGYDYMESCIDRFWQLSNKGIAFNSLSKWAKDKDKDKNEFYADPSLVIDIVKKYTTKIIFRHDYHPRDFTIYVLRDY